MVIPAPAPWIEHLIGTDGANNHDVELGDVNNDGALDVVTRKKSGGWTYLWKQNSPTSWTQITVSGTDGEGTALADLDEDDDLDVVHNGFWVEQVDLDTWVEHTIDSNWADDVGVLAVDINDDGNLDVVLGSLGELRPLLLVRDHGSGQRSLGSSTASIPPCRTFTPSRPPTWIGTETSIW